MILSMMPMTAFAEGTTIYVADAGSDENSGTQESPVKTFTKALELVEHGGTIQIVDTATALRPSEDIPLIIDKKITVQGGTLSSDYAGIVLGADVTFNDITISLNNLVRNCIVANGYNLALNNVKNGENGSAPIHLFGGEITGYKGSATIPSSGNASQITISGTENDLGNIYAGSLSEYGEANAWDKSASITIKPGAKGFGDIYAHGATEPRGEGNPYDMQPDSAKYKVSRDVTVTISISNKNNTVDCDTGNGYATLCYESDNANQVNPKLLNVGNLILNGSSPNLAPAEGSTILSTARVTVPNGARLDLSNLTNVSYTDNLTINNFNGGGIITLDVDQIITINGNVTNQTSVELSAIGDFILAKESNESNFVPADETMAFSLSDGLWTAEWEPIPVLDFSLEDVTARAGDTKVLVPATVTYEDEIGSWDFDFCGLEFIVTVDGNNATYDEENGVYVDANTGLHIYPSSDGEYFVVEDEDGFVAGTYEIGVTVPAEDTVSGVAITKTVSVTYTGEKAILDVIADNKIVLVGEPLPELTYTIRGFLGSDTENSAVSGSPILTYEENATTSSVGDYFIYIDCSDMYADNYEFNTQDGMLYVREHIHNLTGFALGTVNAENDSILATCTNGCTEGAFCVLTIVAPEAPVYSEGEWQTAALYGYADIDVELSSEDIVYTLNGQVTEPIEAGTYVASITYKGLTASVTYTVAEPTPTPTPPETGGSDGNNSSSGSSGGSSSSIPEKPEMKPNISIPEDAESNSDSVVVDFSKSDSDTTEVKLSSEVIEKITEAIDKPNKKVEIVLNEGFSIELPAKVLDEKIKELGGKDIDITIISQEKAEMSSEQKAEVGDRPAYDITIASGGKNISDMGGMITVKVPYELKAKEKPSGIVVCYVDENGKSQCCKTIYDWKNKSVRWQTDHLSLYMIDYVENLLTSCDRTKECPCSTFTDVNNEEWYHNGIHYCVEQELMQGVADNMFGPGGTATRAQFVTMLWRLEGKPVVNYYMQFKDVDSEQWYTEAVRWAAAEKIVSGDDTERFGVNDAITREQMVTILHRYCTYKGIDVSVGEDTNILSYADALSVQEWAISSMQWACGSGVIEGISDGENMNLKPSSSTSRAQIATMLWRFCDNQ